MTLGEKISTLRNQHNMSQGALAEKMNVSRQSISKWETDNSVPELDKLIQLSEVFNITLDELVKGEALQKEAPKEIEPQENESASHPAQVIAQKSVSTQTIVGLIFLATGLLCCVLAIMFGSGLLVLGGYIIFCSIICLLIKRYAGLLIGWITMLLITIFSPYFTAVRMFAVFHAGFYQKDISIVQIVTILLWLIVAVLVVATVRAFRKKR